MYKVIRAFNDLQDNGYSYKVGDDYPRKNFKVNDERLKELSSKDNKLQTPLIKKVGEDKKPTEKKPAVKKGKKK